MDKFTHKNSTIITHPIVLALGWATYFKFNYEVVTSHECVIYADNCDLVVTYNSVYIIVSRVNKDSKRTIHYYASIDDDNYMDCVLDCASDNSKCAKHHSEVQIVSDARFKPVLQTIYEIAGDARFEHKLSLFRDWVQIDILDARFIVSNCGEFYTVTYWRIDKPYDVFFINFPCGMNAITLTMNMSRLARKRLGGYMASKSVNDFCIDF